MSSTSSQIITDEPARLGTTSATLSYFCVYNPSLGPTEETAKDQILYYTAKKVVPADIKMKQVGLAQALVNFTSTFSPQSIQNVHSQKNRMVFLQAEPGFWMHMCVELGILRKQIKDTKGKEKLVTEYLDSQLNDRALECVLRVGYEQFKLLNGTFSSILCENDQTNRQRTRALMHAIEEFFSEWIWRWDFENLAACFTTTVFNGVPIRPIVRSNYMRINTMDKHLQDTFDHAISHVMLLDHANGLVYRSTSLSIYDVRSLRKYIMKRVEKHHQQEKNNAVSKMDLNLTGLKQLTKTLSNTHILNYFTTGSKSTEPTPSISTESEHHVDDANPNDESEYSKQGVYLTGLVESTAIGMNGEERPITKTDIIRVYLSSQPEDLQDIPAKEDANKENNGAEELTEYYLVVYKHKSGLVWCFLFKAASESEDLLSDPSFYSNLENQMMSQNLDQLVSTIIDNINSREEKSLQLEKNFKCFYYDNTTLAIKSTLMESNIVNNEMLLQMLEIKDDFEDIARTSEVYTRSTHNYWIAGHRIYNGLSANDESSMARSSLYDCSVESDDYVEMYLVAAKKDTSLADVEDTLKKMTDSLLDTMHAE